MTVFKRLEWIGRKRRCMMRMRLGANQNSQMTKAAEMKSLQSLRPRFFLAEGK